MKTTIAIPCYNSSKTIKNSLLAAINQFHKPDEIIVVDDNSSDGSQLILSEIEKTTEKLQLKIVFHKKNKGIAQTRNTAIKHAIGDIIIFVDADAICEQDLLKKIVMRFEEDDEIAGVGGVGKIPKGVSVTEKWWATFGNQGHGEKVLENVWMLPGICSAYKKSSLKKVNCFDPMFKRYAEDVDIGIRLNKIGERLIYDPEIIVTHRTKNTDFKSILYLNFQYLFWSTIAMKKNKANLVLPFLDWFIWSLNSFKVSVLQKKDFFLYSVCKFAILSRLMGIVFGIVRV